jgi:hypothetical protein
VTPIAQQLTFRDPTGVISGTFAAPTVQPDQQAMLTVTGSTEAPQEVFATIRAAGGAPCAQTASADGADSRYLLSEADVNGAFSLTATTQQTDPGAYLVCLWLADSSSDPTPTAGPQPVTLTVAAPPPPCIVPALAQGTPLAQVTAALGSASCTLGRRRYVASRRFARGALVKLTPTAGTTLGNSARVDVLLSSGAPCVVPKAVRGMRLSTARRRLARSGCRPGKVRRVRSRRKRGTVVSFAPRSGSRRSPRSIIAIRVSRGRR